MADALFATAAEWLRARGLEVMRGPTSFSTNDECGLLVRGYDTPPTLMMPHNPPYYERLVDAAGFTKARDLLVYRGGYEPLYMPVPERLARGTELLKKRMGLSLRPFNQADFRGEVERIKQLYNRCWEKNWGFVPMTDHEIDHLAEQFKPVVVPDLVPFVELDGEPIGFCLTLPDLNQVFRKHRSGRLTPLLLADLLLSLKIETPSAGADPAARRPARASRQGCRRGVSTTGSGPRPRISGSRGARRGGSSRTTRR